MVPALLLSAMLMAPLQRPDTISVRPRLPAGADTNDANAYYTLGNRRLRENAREAGLAFWWAMRLDPQCAGCVYGRAIAGLIENPGRLRGWFLDDPGTLRRTRYLDSLRERAAAIDPFVFRGLDIYLVAGVTDVLGHPSMERALEDYLVEMDSSWAAMVRYSKGRFDDALRTWAGMMRGRPRNASLPAERARAFFLTGRHDSALAQLREGLRIARAQDAERITVIYDSKAAWEYSLGRIYQATGAPDSARRAFERALEEDLAFVPAHVQLGMLHLARGDTVAALQEFRTSVELRESEYTPRVLYGFHLANDGMTDSALTHLRRAAELEPFAAQPRLLLGVVHDGRREFSQAADAFEAWLARTPQSDTRIGPIRARVAQLRAMR